jgi:hypothetical protein
MKKFAISLALCSALILAGCSDGVTVIDGKKTQPYGLLTPERADPTIKYEASAVNVIIAIILVETIFVPVYVAGWDLYVPIGKKEAAKP